MRSPVFWRIKKKALALLLSIGILAAAVPFSVFASGSSSAEDGKASIYCWSLFLMNEGSYPDVRPFLRSLNIGRVYQEIPQIYLQRPETAAMVSRLKSDGIETVALMGDRSWGLESNDLQKPKQRIDNLAAYNSGAAGSSKISAIALDVETYTYSSWKSDPVSYFETYIAKMQELYAYAHSKGFSVVQVIPVHYDSIDKELTREFFATCCDEISLMNYYKAEQVTAIRREVALCRELGIPCETIFETMPYDEKYSVTEDITYYYEGLDALNAKKDEIFTKYGSEGLSVSYHHLNTMFHVATGKYIAEIYAYTDENDPHINDLGQSEALSSITLTGDDGSVITAGLYNPNLKAEYKECCYLAYGISPGVTYTFSSGSISYTVQTAPKAFEIEENTPVNYSSIHIQYTGIEPPDEPEQPEETDIDFSLLGASIRISEPYGIRFGIRLGKDKDYGNVTTVEYGTLLKPSRLLGDEELTLDTPDARRIPGRTIYSENDTELIYTGVLINIPSDHLDEVITGRGYLIYQDAEGASHTVYTDMASKSFNEVVELAYAKYAAITNPTEEQLAVLAKLEKLRQ